MPAHPVAQKLINAARIPLAAPSANRFGRISPTTAQAVEQELGDRIPLILDGGPCDIGLESTVISVTDTGEPVLLRPGGIAAEQIAEVLGTEVIQPAQARSQSAPQPAPGMLASHYAPRKTLRFLPERWDRLDIGTFRKEVGTAKIGILLQGGPIPTPIEGVSFSTLSESGNRAEAARNLFAKLRALDDSDAELLFVEPVPSQEGLDHAILDRLTRAAAQRA
jgi:L-threonylcarbamoyladenylate synthase